MTRNLFAASAVAALTVAAVHAGQSTHSATNHLPSAVKPMPAAGTYLPPRTPDGQPDIQAGRAAEAAAKK